MKNEIIIIKMWSNNDFMAFFFSENFISDSLADNNFQLNVLRMYE